MEKTMNHQNKKTLFSICWFKAQEYDTLVHVKIFIIATTSLQKLLLQAHFSSRLYGGFSFRATSVALLKGVGVECMRCRGETNELFEQKASRQGVVRCVWTRKTVAKVLTESEVNLFAFHFFCWEGITFLLLCSPHQKESLCSTTFCGIKTKQVCKWLWIESFGAVLQKSTCQAGPKSSCPSTEPGARHHLKAWD